MSSEGDDYGPTENEAEESPKKKKRQLGKEPTNLRKGALDKPTPKVLGDNPPLPLKAPREPAIELSPATTNLNHFHKNLPRFSIDQDARFEYTPAEERTKHVLDCAVHDDRDFKLISEPTLEDTTHRNGRKTKAWRIQVSDSKDPDNILQPFRLGPHEQAWASKYHGPQSEFPMDQTYIYRQGRTRAFAVYTESLRIPKSAVPTLKDATDIAEIFCRVLNRTPLDLPSFDTWSRQGDGVTTCHRVTRFTELVTLFHWKNTIDLSDVDTSHTTFYMPPNGKQVFKIISEKSVERRFFDPHQNIVLNSNDRHHGIRVTIDPTLVDRVKAAGIVVPPAFLTLCGSSTASTYEFQLARSVFQYMQWRLFGHIGTPGQFKTDYSSLRATSVDLYTSSTITSRSFERIQVLLDSCSHAKSQA